MSICFGRVTPMDGVFYPWCYPSFYSFYPKKDDKDQETIQSSTTPDPGYNMGKYQKYNKRH